MEIGRCWNGRITATLNTQAMSAADGSTEPAEGQQGQHAIARAFGECDDQQKASERFAHDAGDQGQWVTDNRQPTEQQRPMAVTRS